jgi:hypothetical protein
MNLTSFGAAGAPPTDHIPDKWPFVSSKFAPFATNLQVQVLTCSDRAAAANLTGEETSRWPFANAHDDEEDEADDLRRRVALGPAGFARADDPGPDTRSRYVRVVLNDAPVPLTGLNGCDKNDNGLCKLDGFVSSLQTLIGQTDFAHDCFADYDYDADQVTEGRPPRR